MKQYGPVVGCLLALILWQTKWINRLLDRYENAYTGEIDRMHLQMSKLLEHILGQQPSSGNAPLVKELLKETGKLPKRASRRDSSANQGGGTT